MPVTNTPQTPFEAAVTSASSALTSQAFDGDFQAFHRTFQGYLEAWGSQDPFARHLLNRVNQRTNPLAFRSLSTDRKELNHQASLRWDAWLSVMPLDMQLSLLLLEGSPYLPSPDFSKFHWESWKEVSQSKNPVKAFRASPLGGWVGPRKTGPGSPMNRTQNTHGETETSPKTWNQVQDRLVRLSQGVAAQLAAFKKWEELDSYMGHAGLSAADRLQDVYVHYRTTSSRGSTLALLNRPLPLWIMGLYVGASEPEFWEVMARHGGPSGPCLGPAWDTPDRHAVSSQIPPPADLVGVETWIEPQANLDPAALESMGRVAADWRSKILEQTMTANPTAPRQPRF